MVRIINPLPRIAYCLECGESIRAVFHRKTIDGVPVDMLEPITQDFHTHALKDNHYA